MDDDLKGINYDLTAERQIIAGLLSIYSNEAIEIVYQKIKPEDFYDNEYRVLFKKIIEMHEENTKGPLDYLTFYNYLKNHPPGKEYNFNQKYLQELADDFYSIEKYRFYASEVVRYSHDRQYGNIDKKIDELIKQKERFNIISIPEKEGDIILKNFPNLVVVGEIESGEILLYSRDTMKTRTIKVSNLTQQDIISIAGKKHHGSIADFKNAIAFKARDKQLYRLDKKGQGIWKYKDKLLIINGRNSGVWENGKMIETIDFPLWKDCLLDFGQNWINLENYSKLKAKETFSKLENHFLQWNFRDPFYSKILTALIIATPIQTIFPWKPHIYLTGRRNTGKTTLIENIQELFGKLGLKIEGSVTEASLRQSLQNKSLCVTIDEFEKFKNNRDLILKLLRISNKGGTIQRGTTSGNVINFTINNIVWLASIENPLKDAADQSRFIKIELRPFEGKGLKYLDDKDEKKISQNIIYIGLKYYKDILKKRNEIISNFEGELDSRLIECYAVPCSIIDIILGENGLNLLNTICEKNKYLLQVQEDEERLIETILTTKVTIRTEKGARDITIGNLIQKARDDVEYNDYLNDFGCSVTYSDNKEVISFCTPMVQRNLLEKTDWQGLNIKDILKRVYGAFEGRNKIAGRSMRTINIPIQEIILDGKESDDLPF